MVDPRTSTRANAKGHAARTLAVALCLLWVGAVQAQADDEAAIHELAEVWETRYNEGDMEGIGALYTEDALYATSTGTLVEGGDQVAALFQGYLDAGYETVALDSRKVRVEGDMAYNFGHWQLTHTDGSTNEGYYSNVLVRGEDGWKYDHNGNSAIEPEEE